MKVHVKLLHTRLFSVVLCDPPLPSCGRLTPAAAWGLWGKQYVVFERDDIIPPQPKATLHSCLGVTFLLVLQSQTDYYPTTHSKEASSSCTKHKTQIETFVSTTVGPVDSLSLVFAFARRWSRGRWTCCVHASLSAVV